MKLIILIKKRLNENFTEFAIFKDDQISTEINILGNYEGNELNLILTIKK